MHRAYKRRNCTLFVFVSIKYHYNRRTTPTPPLLRSTPSFRIIIRRLRPVRRRCVISSSLINNNRYVTTIKHYTVCNNRNVPSSLFVISTILKHVNQAKLGGRHPIPPEEAANCISTHFVLVQFLFDGSVSIVAYHPRRNVRKKCTNSFAATSEYREYNHNKIRKRSE